LLALLDRLNGVSGVRRRFASPLFHEATLSLDARASTVLDHLCDQGLLAGLDLREFYPELGDAVLVCTTETKSAADLDRYVRSLAAALSAAPGAAVA
jgi:glycine dehydrogenase subunit 1